MDKHEELSSYLGSISKSLEDFGSDVASLAPIPEPTTLSERAHLNGIEEAMDNVRQIVPSISGLHDAKKYLQASKHINAAVYGYSLAADHMKAAWPNHPLSTSMGYHSTRMKAYAHAYANRLSGD